MSIGEEFGVQITHHFGYWKRTLIPAGVMLGQHKHKFDHFSLLIKGMAKVEVDGEWKFYKAPSIITIEAGKIHNVTSVDNVEWWCLHETDERDVSKIDEAFIENT